MIEIVIKMDDKDYKRILAIPDVSKSLAPRTYSAIRNGTPLPEHHGRIIDESKITSVCYHEETYKSSTVSCCHTVIDGTDAPTIIEGSESE